MFLKFHTYPKAVQMEILLASLEDLCSLSGCVALWLSLEFGKKDCTEEETASRLPLHWAPFPSKVVRGNVIVLDTYCLHCFDYSFSTVAFSKQLDY